MTNPPDREVAVFTAAVTLAAAERAAYLDQACAGDPALRLKIQALLRVHDDVGDFLEAPAEAAAPPPNPAAPAGPRGTVRINPVPDEKVGTRIGRYKLREKIGEGGCGVVYVADQEEPVRRRVALKVIKLGMDTNSVIARFEAERQALAMMDHPNIAKVLDAGATETGRPYFVMELVRGIRITEYCDQNNLSVPERLKLFTQVCQAIQHAHQKGIIHRDIKPSNILVTLHDGVPVPKVIDFGIAKATEGRLTDLTVYTELHQFIGTPAYMSPEQAEMSGLNIDTRSDIYALGVLLYELLTGQTPFDPKELLKSGLDEMRRTIREQEPQRPSTRLSTMLNADLTAIAKGHGTQAPKLVHLIRGDLDWVVMKALEKDRTRRYETANGLAMDIQRHLNNEPVIACPPTNFYRFQKMVRRNKGAFAAATAVFAALIAGLGVSTCLFVRERHAQRETEAALASEAALRQKSEYRETIAQAQLLYDDGKYDEAETLLNKIPPSHLQTDFVHASMRRGLGWWRAIHEQWKEAAANFAVLVQLDGLDDRSVNIYDCQFYAAALVQCGDTNGYEKFRQAALSRYGDMTDGTEAAMLICKITLLLPADEKTMARLARLYEVLLRGQKNPAPPASNKTWDCLSLAMVDYRRGDYPKTIERCRLCLNAPLVLGRTATAQAILALACHQLHQDAEARAALAQGRQVNKTLMDPEWMFPLGKLDGNAVYKMSRLFDGVFGQMMLNEASALIEGAAPAGGEGYAAAQYQLGMLYSSGSFSGPNRGVAKNSTEAAKWYRKASDGGNVPAMNELAWLLATSTNAWMRNGSEAVALAEKAVAGTSRTNGGYLDTLAAAYAETGQFEKAVRAQKEVTPLEQNEGKKAQSNSRLKLYESNSPYRDGN
jgi:tetratricopeptide (TPR) repeat protein